MSFSPLEAALLASFMSLITGLAVKARSISPDHCTRTQEQMVDMIESLKTSQDIQFRMLRAIVLHLDLPAKDKSDIMNMRPTKE